MLFQSKPTHEMLLEAESLYEIHQEQMYVFTGDRLPTWDELSWQEQDAWQAQADELNEARRSA